jgi:hypothetical protein
MLFNMDFPVPRDVNSLCFNNVLGELSFICEQNVGLNFISGCRHLQNYRYVACSGKNYTQTGEYG